MTKINFEKYNKKRKRLKVDLLQLRDELDITEGEAPPRDEKKRDLLFEMARKRKNNILNEDRNNDYSVKKEDKMEYSRLKKKLNNILSSNKEDLYKKIAITALITEALKELGVKAVIVGGQAVEFYTSGGYTTMDIDIICEESINNIDSILRPLGFKRDGKYWTLKNSNIAIEVPSGPLAGSWDKINKVEIEDMIAYIIGIEDIIIDRLNRFKYWDVKKDKEWIMAMIYVNFEEIDEKYLLDKAEEEGTKKELMEFMEVVQEKLDK